MPDLITSAATTQTILHIIITYYYLSGQDIL